MAIKSLLKLLLLILIYIPLALYLLSIPSNYDREVIIAREGINPIKILRDEYGVPHVFSKTLKDIFYGIGYAQAQDRLWEMNFKKLIFSGRLSEYFGQKTLEMDKIMRNFGFHRTAKINFETMPSDEKELLQSFADGINDYVHSLKVLPLEFLINGVNYEDWTPVDTILAMKLMEFTLTLNWNQQLLRHYLEEFYEREFVKEVTCSGEENHYDLTKILSDEELKQSGLYYENKDEGKKANKTETTTKEKVKKHNENNNIKREYLAAGLENMINSLYEIGRGSNSWVIHGNHTTTGKPILANDPHLDNAMPSIWYPVYLNYDDNNIFGFTNAGSPFAVIGQTPKISWGITAFLGDDSDVFKEKLDEEKNSYEYDGKYYPLEKWNEEIKIKGEAPFVESFMATKHGVILNKAYDIITNSLHLEKNKEYFSFAWTGHLKKNYIVKTILKIHSSKNVYEFREAMNIFESVYLNLVFADVEGNIGYCMSGLNKIKNKIPDNEFFPLDGTKSENDWLGYVPKNENIFVINPTKGYIVTANNKPSSNNIKYDYVKNGKPTARSLRINNLIKGFIENKKKISVEDVKKMQLDTVDEYAKVIVPALLKILKAQKDLLKNEEDKLVINNFIASFAKWDCDMHADSKEALIYNAWFSIFSNKLLPQIQPQSFQKRIVDGYGFEQFIMRKILEWSEKKESFNAAFCSENNVDKNSCIWNIFNALIETYSLLEQNLGKENESKWKWKTLHYAKYPHLPFSNSFLKYLYEKNIPRSGNTNTVNVAVLKTPQNKVDFYSGHSGNLRFVSSLNKKEKSFFVIDSGVSENPFSIHYTDFMELHKFGKYVEIKSDILNNNASHITLLKSK